ncbi:MFS transporter [Corynebacterium heidelbergense]|uniref:MFS transporter n=1 Tax=Corynebacterium heidelbergense TaxID=2055947 RepID=A0A364V747_9CORY|nr:MFS transporter [Corynebacterium heidelbergense]RAV32490.1 MFS transporter [Corynebacterium heidelbergense]
MPVSAQKHNPKGLAPGESGYARALIAALCAGLASFNAMYVTQAVLPSLSQDFGVSPTIAALSVSATTGGLALAVIPVGIISERFGRYRVLQISVLVATLLSFLVAVAPGMGSIIAIRAVQGLAVAGVPAVMMTYLAEEIHSKHLPRVMGFYIAGTTIGGLLGRIIPGVFLEFASWRVAVAASALFSVLTAALTAWVLPRSANFRPKKITILHELAAFRGHFANPILLRLFLIPFLIMGTFVSLYNYVGYRLISEFGLAPSLAAFAFLLYLSGTWSSARAGVMVQKWGRGKVLALSTLLSVVGLIALLPPFLVTTLIAALLFTASFFAAHSVASGWVGAAATKDRAEASSTYILSYYLGSSFLGGLSGEFFQLGWGAFVAWLAGLTAVAFVLAAGV